MPPPARSARPPKRPFVEDDIGADATDGEWTPQQSTSKSPAPPKPKAAKASPGVSKNKPGHTLVTTQIKNNYITERGHPPLSGRWFQEKTKQPEFWRDIKKFTSASTLKQRVSTYISVDDISQPASMLKPVTPKKVRSANRPVVGVAFVSGAGGDTIAAQMDVACRDCGAECADGRLTCDSCLAQEDDGFADTIVIKAEGQAEGELPESPVGGKGDPIKLEDDTKCEELEDEEERTVTSPGVVKDGIPTLFTLDDGSQFVMFNGLMIAVKSAIKMGLEK